MANVSSEIEAIKAELQSIITELQNISRGVQREFIGIGSEKCAACISNVASLYVEARRKISNIDTNRVAESEVSGSAGGGYRG